MPCQPSPSQVARGVVVVLADHQCVRPLGLGGASYGACHLVVDVDAAEPPRHVGHVDPPAVHVVRRPQPPRDHAVGSFHHRPSKRGNGVVELGQRGVPHPALVAAVGAEVEPVPAGRGRRGGRGDEPLVGVAGVVGGQVAEDPPAAGVHRRAEPGVRVVAAEQWVDGVERRRVVAMVALAGEHRRRVHDCRAEPARGGRGARRSRRGRRRRAGWGSAGRCPRTPPRRPSRPAPPRPASAGRRRRPTGRTGPGRSGRRPRRGPSRGRAGRR